MKKYELRKEKDGNYTVYKNPNEKLKAEISNFKPDTTQFETYFPPATWVIGEKEGDEYRCTSGKNVQYFPVSEVEEKLKGSAEESRNKKFQAYSYFKDCFGTVSCLREYKGRPCHLSVLDITKAIPMGSIVGIGDDLDTTSVNFYNTEFRYEIETYQALGIEISAVGTSMCLYFTEEGDFINRDYNVDLSTYENRVISPSVILDEVKQLLKEDLGSSKVETDGKKFYTSKKCYIPYVKYDGIGFEVIPVRSNGTSYQVYSGDPIYKKPADSKLKPATIEDMLSLFDNVENPVTKCLLSDDFLNVHEVMKQVKEDVLE